MVHVQDGKSALLWLTSTGVEDYVEAIQLLIDAGADVDVADTTQVRVVREGTYTS